MSKKIFSLDSGTWVGNQQDEKAVGNGNLCGTPSVRMPVVFCVDRAGVVGQDGVTHQGVFDIAMLRCLPNLVILQPKDADELKAMLEMALAQDGPVAIRYPKGSVPAGSVSGVGLKEVKAEVLDIQETVKKETAGELFKYL